MIASATSRQQTKVTEAGFDRARQALMAISHDLKSPWMI